MNVSNLAWLAQSFIVTEPTEAEMLRATIYILVES